MAETSSNPSAVAGLTLVVPAKDEVVRLPPTLEAASRVLPGLALASEIVVVDDGSRDGTAALAARFAGAVPIRVVRLERNRGKGAAVAAGIAAARHPFVAFTDADCPYDLSALRPMLEALAGRTADVAIGARDLVESGVSRGYGPLRRLSGKMLSGLTRAVIGLPMRDSQCGLKAFRTETARSLFAVRTIDGFGFDFELLAAALANGLVVERFPVRLSHDDDSRVDVLRDGLAMFRQLWLVRAGLRRGDYRLPVARQAADGAVERAGNGAAPVGGVAARPRSETASAAVANECPLCGSSERRPRARRGSFHMVECDECGLWRLDPLPTRAALERFYRDEYYANGAPSETGYGDYAAQADDLRATFAERLDLVAESRGRLLDVGGGFGFLADAAAATGRFPECWVVETSESAAARVAPGHRRVVGWFPDVDLPEAYFDLASLQDSFEHLPDPRATLARLHGVLRPGGRLLVATPNTASLIARLQRGAWVSLKFPEHVLLWSPRPMRRALREAGFEIERIVPAGQWVRLDFLAHRVFSGRPRAGAAAARALRAIGAGGVRAWVPSGSIAVVAARPGDGRSRDREADGGEPS